MSVIRKTFLTRVFSKIVIQKKRVIAHNSNLKLSERAQFYAVTTLNVINNTSVIPIDRAVTNGGMVPKYPLYGVCV